MNRKEIFLILSCMFLFVQTAFTQVIKMSLNSSDGIAWQVKPQDDLQGVRGENGSLHQGLK